MTSATTNRETWLNALAAKMAPRFEELGHPVPPFRVSIGFTGAPKKARALGVCYHSKASADGRFEIFIVPKMADPMDVGAILAHELTHAAVGFKCGHKGAFATVVAALGFQRPFTELHIGDALRAWLQPLLEELGPLPHAALADSVREGGEGGGDAGEDGDGEDGEPTSSNDKKKQSTRLLKASCTHEVDGKPCGYTVRLSKKWALKYGACCPVHGAMEVEGADEQAEGEDE